MEDDAIKTLIASSEPLPEMEDEYDGQDELIQNSEMQSSFINIISSIGKEEFEYVYFSLINEIKLYDIKDQISFCEKILEKIKEVYNFEFLTNIEIIDNYDVNNVYDFIEFLEFKNIDFLVNLLTGIVLDIRRDPVRMIFDKNWLEIESRILKENLSQLITLFLRTNNREDLLDFLTSKATKNKILITMNLFERSSNNANS